MQVSGKMIYKFECSAQEFKVIRRALLKLDVVAGNLLVERMDAQQDAAKRMIAEHFGIVLEMKAETLDPTKPAKAPDTQSDTEKEI